MTLLTGRVAEKVYLPVPPASTPTISQSPGPILPEFNILDYIPIPRPTIKPYPYDQAYGPSLADRYQPMRIFNPPKEIPPKTEQQAQREIEEYMADPLSPNQDSMLPILLLAGVGLYYYLRKRK